MLADPAIVELHMRMFNFGLLPISLFALGACGKQVDDPQNIPELGMWRSQVQISGVEIGSRTLTYQESKKVEKAFGDQTDHDELGCTEPKLNSVEELADKMPPKFAAMCTLSSTGDGASYSAFQSDCDQSKFPPEVKQLDFSGETNVKPDRVTMRLRVKTTTLEEDGNTETLKFVQERTFWRVGSCSG